jgi:Cu2+-exporting ATPase
MPLKVGTFKSFVNRAKTYAHDFSQTVGQEYRQQFKHQTLGYQLLTTEEKHLVATMRLPNAFEQTQIALTTLYEQASDSMAETIEITYEHIRSNSILARDRRANTWLQPSKTTPRVKRSSFGLTEHEVDTNLKMSITAVSLDILGSLLFPPLQLLAIPFIIIPTVHVFKYTWIKLVRQHKIDVAFTVCLTIVATIATGQFGLSVATSLINSIAFKLQFRIQNDSKYQLINVFKQQPHVVYLLIDGAEVRTPFAHLQRGDIVVVHTGDIIPVDGVIVAGVASIDQHMLTGESQPAEKGEGEQVFASTVVLSGSLQIKAEKAGEETTVAQIGHMLNTTMSAQTEVQLRAEEMANATVPPTLLLGLLTMFTLGPVPAAALVAAHFGLRMNIVAPLAVLNYFRITSQQGILIKDGRMLDMLRDVDTVVFDKTGTLTVYQPHVGQVHTWDGVSERTILAWAAAAECKQTHPIALAIVEAANERNIPLPPVANLAYEVGYGLAVEIDGAQVYVGSHRFMQKMGIELPVQGAAVEEAAHEQGHSLVLVAREQAIVGAIELVPTLRPEAPQMIADLRQRGIQHIAIISGDREAPTRKLAADLGIDEYFAETLPQHKADIIQQLRLQGRCVCYVGDGINDAIALKQAHVSVSLGGASTIATDTAQIILLEEGLVNFGHLFDVARSFDRTMKACFALVLAPSIIGMGGVWLLNFGLAQTLLFKQISLILGASGAMVPLVRSSFNPPAQAEALLLQEPDAKSS